MSCSERLRRTVRLRVGPRRQPACRARECAPYSTRVAEPPGTVAAMAARVVDPKTRFSHAAHARLSYRPANRVSFTFTRPARPDATVKPFKSITTRRSSHWRAGRDGRAAVRFHGAGLRRGDTGA